MSVFGHGQLRLYLLAVLSEGPRHGYDIIRALEERFSGLYSPSAGTVYPRLAKLEEEGLVERTDDGRKAFYRLTEAGREEVEARAGEIAELESSLDASAHRLAEEMRRRVRSGAADLRSQIAAATADLGEEDVSSRYWAETSDSAGERPPQDRHGLDDLFTALTRGQRPDADAIARAAQSLRRLAEGTPWQQWTTGERQPDVGRPQDATSSPSPSTTGEGASEGTDQGPEGATDDRSDEGPQESEPVNVPEAAEVTSPIGEAATAVVATPVQASEDLYREDAGDGEKSENGAGEDRSHAREHFPSAEQVREVVAILKDAGERIQDVLSRPR